MTLTKRFLKDAAVYNSLMFSTLTASVAQNPEIWVHDYPPDIKEKYGPPSEEARRLTRIWAVPFMALAMGYVVLAGIRLRKEYNGRLPFKTAFKYTYLLFLSFWTFDLVILDWLLFSTIQPDFIILPGTEGMAGYKDYAFHLKVSLPALPLLVIPSTVIAWLISR